MWYDEFNDIDNDLWDLESPDSVDSLADAIGSVLLPESTRGHRFAPGQIVQIVDSEFDSELGQVVAIDDAECRSLIKLYPHIDYSGLKTSDHRSQSRLNRERPPSYRPRSAAFDENFFKQGELEVKAFPIGDIAVLANFWDGDFFIGKFMYRWFDLAAVFPLGESGITQMEKSRFLSGIAPFERDIAGFVQEMESTRVETRIAPNPTFGHNFSIERTTPPQRIAPDRC
jgi:hypothetical protein